MITHYMKFLAPLFLWTGILVLREGNHIYSNGAATCFKNSFKREALTIDKL